MSPAFPDFITDGLVYPFSVCFAAFQFVQPSSFFHSFFPEVKRSGCFVRSSTLLTRLKTIFPLQGGMPFFLVLRRIGHLRKSPSLRNFTLPDEYKPLPYMRKRRRKSGVFTRWIGFSSSYFWSALSEVPEVLYGRILHGKLKNPDRRR